MISVVIPSFNSAQTIEACLNALHQQSYEGEYDITLVDSSADDTPRIVTEKFPNIQFIHLATKTDPGTARNIGIANSNADIIAFIDSDCVADYKWLETIASAHNSPFDVVGGAVRNGNPWHDRVALSGYLSEFREFLPNRSKAEVGHIPTCNISYKRHIFERFGLFDGRYYPQEDLVYNYRLTTKGTRIMFDPSIVVSHHHRTRFNEFISHQKRIGCITSQVLKTIPLQGSSLARNPAVGMAVLPILPMVKFFRTVLVFARYHPEMLSRRLSVLFPFFIGLLFWANGFGEGLLINHKDRGGHGQYHCRI